MPKKKNMNKENEYRHAKNDKNLIKKVPKKIPYSIAPPGFWPKGVQ